MAAAFERTRVRDFLPATLLLVLSVAGLFAVMNEDAKAGDPVAVIFSPTIPRDAALATILSAGGELIREGAWPNILITRSSVTGFHQKLYDSGAWAIFDLTGAAGCLAQA